MGKIRIRHFVCQAGLLLLLAASAFSQDRRLYQDLADSFRKVEVASAVRDGTTLSITSDSGVIRFDIAPHDLRNFAYKALDAHASGESLLERQPTSTYKGKITGESNSEVRLTIRGAVIEGSFTLNGERFFIEPASRYSRFGAIGEHVIYRYDDVIVRDSTHCGLTIAEKIGLGKDLAVAEMRETPLLLRRIELATEADFEYVTALGGAGAANNEILSILNMVEGMFEAELGLSISVVQQHTWSVADPFAGANIEAVMQNFRGYWNLNFPVSTTPRDATHLFSGKPNVLGQGWAYVGVVCRSADFAYGVSGRVDWAPAKFLLTAHELGHNVGANHVDAAQGCSNSLMNTSLTGATPLSFCAYSQNEIQQYTAANGSCLSSVAGCGFDFDGDSKADLGVFRSASGTWYLNQSTAGFAGTQFGQIGDKPVAADYDGDGRSDIAVFREGVWYRLDSSTNTFRAAVFGLKDDIPVPADFDGDGRSDIAVFRPANGYWYQTLSGSNSFAAVRFGTDGDVPVAADFDGDGKADVNLFRPSNGTWYRIESRTTSFYAIQYGMSGDKPVMGDFDGDARANVAVWRPANGVWYILRSNGSTAATAFGLPTDIPTPADFDGDGLTDISVYRPSNGTWYRLNSSNGAFAAAQFGIGTDAPVQSYYLR